MLYRVGQFIFWLYFTLFYRVKMIGSQNIPKTGPVLIYANHPTALDMFLIAYKVKRPIHYMAKVELFKNPIVAFLLRGVGAFPVSRGKGDVGSVKTAFRLLQEGKIVGVFPEGTRTPKKDPKKRKAGAALLAVHTNAPIVPIGIGGRIKPFSKVEIIVGEPFMIKRTTEEEHPGKDELVEITQDIMDKIYALIGQ
ncbi:MAG: 1-acyl-sn-glycerol-3-phosphate acyltransferase [Clostridia bacterium]|nr:1-acyl-sn-glycerol-3-phosphate acyltransferase [Clostridia bacterium]